MASTGPGGDSESKQEGLQLVQEPEWALGDAPPLDDDGNPAPNGVFVVTRVLKPKPRPSTVWRRHVHITLFAVCVIAGFLIMSLVNPSGVSVVLEPDGAVLVDDDHCGTRNTTSPSTATSPVFECTTSPTTDWHDFTASLLFNAGLTPLVLSLYSLIVGIGLHRRRDAVKVAVSGAFFFAGVLLWRLGDVSGRDLSITLGSGLFEIGALFVITKFFFLAEDDEVVLVELEKQLVEALASSGIGLANSYFYNFVVPTTSHLRDFETPVDLELSRGNMVDASLTRSELLILIPRTLDDTNLKGIIGGATRAGTVMQGRPKPKDGVPATHRPMFIAFMQFDRHAGKCAAPIDIPTIISSIKDRADDRARRHAGDVTGPDGKGRRIRLPQVVASFFNSARKATLVDASEAALSADISLSKEILDFQNHLVTLIQCHDRAAQKVRILSVPAPSSFTLEAFAPISESLLLAPPVFDRRY